MFSTTSWITSPAISATAPPPPNSPAKTTNWSASTFPRNPAGPPESVHVIRHIVARVVAHRDLEARARHELLHDIERAEFLAFAAGGAKVVRSDGHITRS